MNKNIFVIYNKDYKKLYFQLFKLKNDVYICIDILKNGRLVIKRCTYDLRSCLYSGDDEIIFDV